MGMFTIIDEPEAKNCFSIILELCGIYVILGIAFLFMKLISSSDTSTYCKAAILKNCPHAIITLLEVIIYSIIDMEPFLAGERMRISIMT